MELREIRTFCAVVETGSFTKAAKILYLTQPTVTLQIQSLENNLGIYLFNRSLRDIVLTESGRVFYEYAKKIISLCDEAVKSVCNVDKIAKGNLRVGGCSSIGEYVLPKELASFKKIYSCAEISLKIAPSLQIIEDLIQGALEIGVVGSKTKIAQLVYKDFIRDELVLIVSSNHPFASSGKITLDQLREEPFLIRCEGSGLRSTLKREFENLGLKLDELNVIMSLGNTSAIKRGVISGIGVSIVPKISIENELKLNLLKEVKIGGVNLFMDFYIAYNPSRFLSKIPELFLEHLLDSIKNPYIKN